jgi:hypothetical protein
MQAEIKGESKISVYDILVLNSNKLVPEEVLKQAMEEMELNSRVK